MTPLCSGDSGVAVVPTLAPGIAAGVGWWRVSPGYCEAVSRVFVGPFSDLGFREEFYFRSCEPSELVLAVCKPAI